MKKKTSNSKPTKANKRSCLAQKALEVLPVALVAAAVLHQGINA